jgi:hypothetical protein
MFEDASKRNIEGFLISLKKCASIRRNTVHVHLRPEVTLLDWGCRARALGPSRSVSVTELKHKLEKGLSLSREDTCAEFTFFESTIWDH